MEITNVRRIAYGFNMSVILRYLFLPLILLGALMSTSAEAQTEAEIDRLEVSLWPEYDRSAVLVIYRVQLSPETPLPAIVSLPIPAGVGEPHAVATRSEGGELLLADYTRQVMGDWSMVTVVTDSLHVRLEYYDPLTFVGQYRSYSFIWPGGLDLGAFLYEVQQPLGASNLGITPPGEASVGEDGLIYFKKDLGPQPVSS
ncbi:MAG TPA: hypothetical protein G4O11_05025, partial [Anaerolineae bacterium]|nr:hypothetical protein [Anaerolineae bacterium]